jgi:hypothetical protein
VQLLLAHLRLYCTVATVRVLIAHERKVGQLRDELAKLLLVKRLLRLECLALEFPRVCTQGLTLLARRCQLHVLYTLLALSGNRCKKICLRILLA